MSRKRKYEEVGELKFPVDKLLAEISKFFPIVDIANLVGNYAKPRIISFSACDQRQAFVFDDGNAIIKDGTETVSFTNMKEVSIGENRAIFITCDNKPFEYVVDKSGSWPFIPAETKQIFMDDGQIDFSYVTNTGILIPGIPISLPWTGGPIQSVQWDDDHAVVKSEGKIYQSNQFEPFVISEAIDIIFVRDSCAELLRDGTVEFDDYHVDIVDKIIRISLTISFLLMLTSDNTLWAFDTINLTTRLVEKDVREFTCSDRQVIVLTDSYYCINLTTGNSKRVH